MSYFAIEVTLDYTLETKTIVQDIPKYNKLFIDPATYRNRLIW